MLGSNNPQLSKKLANIISTITHTPLITLFIFIGLDFYFLKGTDVITVTLLSVFFAVLVPSTAAYIWIKDKKLEMDMPNREDRLYPLLCTIISYLLGVITLFTINAPSIITVLMFCYFTNTLLVLIISSFWKISIHTVGVAGPAVFLIYVFGYPGLIFLPLIPIVMWSRLFLKRHTFNQVIAGAILGFVSTTVQIYFLIGF